MATDDPPPNPYAPTAFLTHEAGQARAAARAAAAGKPSRLGAIVLSILAYPLAGAGFYILNRPRRLAGWVVTALALWALMIVAAHAAISKLFMGAMVGLWLVAFAGIIDTAFAQAGAPRTTDRAWLGAIVIILAAKGTGLAARLWLVEAFQIPSGAMVPTLLVGDHIFVKKGRANIARGDVIVFEFPVDRSTDYVKRVVAVDGDTIEVTGGAVSINGVALVQGEIAGECPALEEPGSCKLVRETNAGRSYTIMVDESRRATDHPPTVVPSGHVFVMGDNRDNSYDSRRWGTVPVDHIKGVATVIWWSKVPNGAIRWSRIGRGIE